LSRDKHEKTRKKINQIFCAFSRLFAAKKSSKKKAKKEDKPK